jgi:hypothetical protein
MRIGHLCEEKKRNQLQSGGKNIHTNMTSNFDLL